MTNSLTILPHHKISHQGLEVEEESHVIKLEIKQGKGFIPHFLSSIRSSNHEIKVQTAFPVSVEDFTRLSKLSVKEREYEFLEKFYLRLVRHPHGLFRLHINPRLLGGGSACSKIPEASVPVAYALHRPTAVKKLETSSSSTIPADHNNVSIFFDSDHSSLEKKEMPFESIDQVHSTQDVALFLKMSSPQQPEYLQLQQLASTIIETFRSKNNKTEQHTVEVTALAKAENQLITRELIKGLIETYEKSELLDLYTLQALKTTLLFAPVSALDADDLVRILSITFRQFNKLHKQESTSDKLYATLVSLGELLDLMGDANVVDVKRVELHDAFYKELDTLSSHTELRIASAAAYALQSLVRVPNDESKLMSYVRRGTAAGKIIKNLYDVVSQKDLGFLLDAYSNFKEAYHSQDKKKFWHDEARMASTLIYFGKWKTFEEVIICQGKHTKDPQMAGTIATLIKEALSEKQTPEIQTGCIQLLKDIVLNESRWGSYKSDKTKIARDLVQNENEWGTLVLNEEGRRVKKGVIQHLVYFAGDVNRHIRDEARKCLLDLIHSVKEGPLKDLIKEQVTDVTAIPIRLAKAENKTDFNELFAQSRRGGFLTVVQKVQNIQVLTLKNSDILNDLSTYVPARGSSQIFSENISDFDIQEKLLSFIESQKKVFLLVGESGGGKTLALRALEQHLCKEWNPGKPIPLFIPLAASQQPLGNLIEEALENKQFSSEEIKELKKEHSFIFFLDGYDELNTLQNLYVKNGLQKWNAKVVITCRKQFLAEIGNGYQSLFYSTLVEKKARDDFDECLVRPFTKDQIKVFFQNYDKQNSEKIDHVSAYKTVKKIPGLLGMLENPFLLKLSAEILPEIKARFGEVTQNNQAIMRIDLYEEFTRKWFFRSKSKLIESGSSLNINGRNCIGQAEAIFDDFCKGLAAEMFSSNRVSVEYKPQRPTYSSHTLAPNPWEHFFGNETKEIRNSIPIRTLGSNTYAFLHKSLLEYFGANALEENGSNFKLSSRLITTEYELLKFLAELAQKNASFQQRLMDNVLQTRQKSDNDSLIAAANSITILNKAGIAFSRKDFSGIQVPNADLRGSIFYGANLKGANLSGCLTSQSNFDFANLSLAKLHGIDSGILPSFEGHAASIEKMTLSKDRTILISQSRDAVIAWDLKKKSKIQKWENIKDFFLSPSGEELLLKNDKNLIAWSLNSNERLYAISYTQRTQPCFSSGGAFFLIPHETPVKVSQIETKTGKSLAIFDIEEKFTSKTVWSLLENDRILYFDGKGYALTISTGVIRAAFVVKQWEDNVFHQPLFQRGHEKLYGLYLNDKTLQIFESYKHKSLYKFEHKEEIKEWIFSKDESLVLSKDDNNKVYVWDLRTGQQITTIENVTSTLDPDSFFLNHKKLALAHEDGMIRVWDLDTQKTVKTFLGSASSSAKVVVSHDEKTLLSYQESSFIRLWPLSLLEELDDSIPYTPLSISFINTNGNLVSLTEDGQIQIIEQTSGNILHRLQTSLKSAVAATESLDGTKIFIVDEKRSLSIYSLTSGQLEEQTPLPCSIHTLFQLSNPDHLLIVSKFGEVLIWHLKTHVCLHAFFEPKTLISSCSLSSDRKYLTLSSFEKKLHILDVETRKLLYTGDVEPVSSMIISESRLFLAKRDAVEIRNLIHGSIENTLSHDHNQITSLAYNHKIQRLALGDTRGEIHIWDVKNNSQIFSVKVHRGAIKNLAWSSGTALMSVGKDHLIECWDIADEATLLWRSSFLFSAKNAIIEGSSHLDKLEKNMWIQQGAIEFSEDTLIAKLEKEKQSLWETKIDEFGNTLLHVVCDQYAPIFWEKLIDKKIKINPLNHTNKGLAYSIVSSTNLKEREKLIILKKILKLGVNLGQKDLFGTTPVHYAVALGSYRCLSFFAENGANFNEANQGGVAPAMCASRGGYLDCLQLLAEKGADLNVVTESGWTLAMDGVNKTHLDCLHFLAKDKERFNARNSRGWTPSIIASQMGNLDSLQFLGSMDTDFNVADKLGETPAMYASKKGHLDCLKFLAVKGADLNAASSEGMTPAMYACLGGHPECLQFLAKNRSNLNAARKDGMTLAMLASTKGNAECLQLLASMGADINAADDMGTTPAMLASLFGYPKCLKSLAENGANINAINKEGWTPMHVAALRGRLECLKFLADNGAGINPCDKEGWTPAMLASQNGQLECLQFLADKGADLSICSKNGLTSTMIASQNGYLECLQVLAVKGANLNTCTTDGWTSAIFASQNGHLECLKFLADNGADLNACGEDKMTPAMLASQNGHLDCLRLLADNGANLNTCTTDGWTSAIFASQSGHLKCLQFLADRGADLSACNKNGLTSAMIASRNGLLECLQFLADNGVNINAIDKYGMSPTMLASMNGHLECLRLLAERGADVNAADEEKMTSAMLASMNGHLECLRLLAERGANLNAVNKDGWTAAMLASPEHHGECIRFLTEKGAGLSKNSK